MMAPADTLHLCPTCGTRNKAYATFCPECGEPLDEVGPDRASAAPSRAAARTRRWEVWLGLVLIVGVLGGALADWWQRDTQAQAYRAGIAAITARQWDAAAATFARLGPYRDSAKQRDTIAHAILLRDTSFIAGNEAAAGQDWITAYRALSQTVAIEPDYRHAQALFDTATREAPRQALAGTILRRTDGDRPGLYGRRADGSEWGLAGSDVASIVWTTDPAPGRILYDAPDVPGTAPPPDASVVAAVRQLPPGRHLQLADVRTPEEPPIRLPPLFGSGGYVVLAAQGVWSMGIGRTAAGDEPRFEPALGPPLNRLSYYDIQAGMVLTDVLPGPGFYLLDADPAGHQLLLGRYDPLGTVSPQTRLYRLTSDTLHLLTEVPGAVLDAELSPDGTGILYSAETGSSLTHDTRVTLVWQDLTQPEAAGRLILARPFLAPPDQSAVPHGRIVPGTPQILLRLSTDSPLIMHDVGQGTDTAVWEPSSTTNLLRYWPALDGSAIFVDETTGRAEDQHTLVMQPLDPAGATQRIALPPLERGAHSALLDARPLGPQLIIRALYIPASTTTADTPPPSYEERLYSVPRTGPTSVVGLLGQQPIDIQDILSGMAPQLALLPAGVVAYPTGDGALHLRTLDGATLLPPVPGVNAVWTFQPVPGLLSWNR